MTPYRERMLAGAYTPDAARQKPEPKKPKKPKKPGDAEEGMSSFEIADVVGIHPTTVRKDRRAVAKATAHPLADQASSDIEGAGATVADVVAAETEAVNEGQPEAAPPRSMTANPE